MIDMPRAHGAHFIHTRVNGVFHRLTVSDPRASEAIKANPGKFHRLATTQETIANINHGWRYLCYLL